jgi:hypothetical protein
MADPNSQTTAFSWPRRGLVILAALLLAAALFVAILAARFQSANAQTGLTVEILAPYNLVVDSNVSSPSTYAPSVATVAGKFCNTSGLPMTNVVGYIGNYDGASSTYGVYPEDSGSSLELIHLGGLKGTEDAARIIGDIPANECRVQYWHFTYPQCYGGEAPPCATVPTHGGDVDPSNDLELDFDIWARVNGEAITTASNATWTVTMRNEISAMANKIEPNPSGRWFNTDTSTVRAGQLITTNGVRYTLGNVNKGFDNDADGDFDFNAWMQPVGDASYDPTCFRLVRTSGVLTVTRSGGNPDLLINFVDQLYFTDLPPDNTGVDGNVYYTFMALSGDCSIALSPYQEVASGSDNEKFNADYGAGIPPLGSLEPEVTLTKSGSPNKVAVSSSILYSLGFNNVGAEPAGLVMTVGGSYINTPLVIEDTVPSGTYFDSSYTPNVTFSACGGCTATIYYSTDSGATWTTTKPATQISTGNIRLRFWMNQALPAGGSGIARFQVTTPATTPVPPFIENEACASFGDSASFTCSNEYTPFDGDNIVGDFVWRDENRDGAQTGESANGIDGVKVSIYWDTDNSNSLTDGDYLIETQDTYTNGSAGYYQFTDLPNGEYVVVVDSADASITPGYFPTTAEEIAVTLSGGTTVSTADFGFGPVLSMTKSLGSANPAIEGQLVKYTIELTNHRPGNGNPPGPCVYTLWGNTAFDGPTTQKSWTNYTNIQGAPNDTYATAPFANAGEQIGINNFTPGVSLQPGETISEVYVVFPLFVTPTPAGSLEVRVTKGATTASVTINDVTTLADGLQAVRVDGLGVTFDSNDFANGATTTRIDLIATKAGNPTGNLSIDALGYQVKTNATCGDPSDTMNPVPLTDDYDPAKLQFFTAFPPITSNDTGTGLLSWDNVGPIYGGETKVVTVYFTVKEPPNSDADASPDPTTHTNCASTEDGRLASGEPVNDVLNSCVTHAIEPGGEIGDHVFYDANSSNTYNTGDIPFSNVTVDLYDCGPDNTCGNTDDVIVQSTTTNADGYYIFKGVADIDRQYLVKVDTSTLPTPAYWNTGQDLHTVINPDNTENAQTPVTIDYDDALTTNDNFSDVDFTFVPANNRFLLVGSVWHDVDNSATTTPSGPYEPGLAGVTVYADNGSCAGATPPGTCTTAVTDASGNFVFSDSLANGTYTIRVLTSSLPAGGAWTQTWDTNEDTNPATPVTTANAVGTITVTTEGAARVDYSYIQSGTLTIGDKIWQDWDGDGKQDPAEPGLSGATVELWVDDGDGVIEPTDYLKTSTVTGASGAYSFTNLPPADYIVRVVPPSGYTQTGDPNQPNTTCTTCDNKTGTALTDLTATNNTMDFGYKPVGTGSIGDRVWVDSNANGVQDASETTGIQDITVWLYTYSDGVGGTAGVYDPGIDTVSSAPLLTTTTDLSGNYLFPNLPAGNYLIDVYEKDSNLPTSGGFRYVLSTDDGRTFNGADNDRLDVSLSAGENYLQADFGFAPGARVGDLVWNDQDADGTLDANEGALTSGTAALWYDSDDNGTVDAQYYYDADGDGTKDPGEPFVTDATLSDGYFFQGLPAGNYEVRITPPSGFTQTYDPDAPSVPCSGLDCNNKAEFDLKAGQTDRSQDLAYTSNLKIGDRVWYDVDGDGVQDPGEPGIQGVKVYLVSGGCTPPACPSFTTDEDGLYHFDVTGGVTYNVVVDTATLPAAFTSQTWDRDDGTAPFTTANNSGPIAVPLSPTSPIMDADFGYTQPAGALQISGVVYHDPNRSNSKDPGENTTYTDVTVSLWLCIEVNPANCVTSNPDAYIFVRSDITDGSGYSFTNLPAGNYKVTVSSNAQSLVSAEMTYTTGPTNRGVTLTTTNQVVNFGFDDTLSPTAVTMGDLTASIVANQAVLSWDTVMESNFIGFNVYRSTTPDGQRVKLNPAMIVAEGGMEGATYSYTDTTIQPGTTYYYWLEVIDTGDTFWYGPAVATFGKLYYMPTIFR